MAGVTKKEGRIPPLLPQTSSSSSLSLLPSLSFFFIAPSSALSVDGVAVPDLFESPLGTQPSRAASSSRYPRHSLSPFFLSLSHPRLSFSFSHPLAHSRWVAGARSLSHSDRVGIGRVGEAAASTQATASPRPRPPPSFPSPPLPPSLSPPSLPSIYSSRSFSPSLLPHSGRGCRCRAPLAPRPGRGHRPPPLPPPLPFISSPSLSALPHSPAARPPPCPCPSLVPLPGTRPSGKGPQPSPSDGHAAALHRPFVIIIIIFSFLLSRYPPLSLSLSKPISLPLHHYVYPYVYLFLEGFFFLRMKNHGDEVREKKKNHSPSKNPSHCQPLHPYTCTSKR